jgi:hypothetical protein
MSKKDFTDLDAAIIGAIVGGRKTFTPIVATVMPLAKPHAANEDQVFRVVDRRLQTLRRQGRVAYVKGLWCVIC